MERAGEESRETLGRLQEYESGRGNVPGSPTWPVPRAGSPMPPPVGMNWGTVAERLGADLGVLAHDGAIVLAGDYVPERGWLLEPSTLLARSVEIGDRAMHHGYFLGALSV